MHSILADVKFMLLKRADDMDPEPNRGIFGNPNRRLPRTLIDAKPPVAIYEKRASKCSLPMRTTDGRPCSHPGPAKSAFKL
jgi:hypothetical protein